MSANYPISPNDPNKGLLISVGAHDQQDLVGGFSSGEVVDWSSVTVTNPDGTTRPSMFSAAPIHAVPTIVAPGVGIVEPVTSTTYFSEDGSSMATPHIAAAIALVLSALRAKRPDAKPREAAELLLECVTALPPDANSPPPNIWAGRGRIDPAALANKIGMAIA